MLKGTIGGVLVGSGGGYAGGLIQTGDLSLAHKAGINSVGTGVAIGSVSGFASSYYYSKGAGINPWNGQVDTSNANKVNVLRHYTSEEGYKAIMKAKTLNASVGTKNAKHGSGQYLTDLTSESLSPD